MNKTWKVASLVAFAAAVATGSAQAGDEACSQGKSCELGAAPHASFKKGKVDGAAVWQQDGHANVWFTTSGSAVHTYNVAICGAANVEEVLFEGSGRYKDTKVVSPKGKLGGCDLYVFKTRRGIDGLRVKPQGNSFKVIVQKDGKASDYSMYVASAVMPARAGHYHFRMKK